VQGVFLDDVEVRVYGLLWLPCSLQKHCVGKKRVRMINPFKERGLNHQHEEREDRE
jgi:hypothetical protein